MKTDIKPISVLKNKTADLVREVSKGGRTVIITQHGEAKVVVLGFQEFQRWKDTMAFLKIIAQGEADVALLLSCGAQDHADRTRLTPVPPPAPSGIGQS